MKIFVYYNEKKQYQLWSETQLQGRDDLQLLCETKGKFTDRKITIDENPDKIPIPGQVGYMGSGYTKVEILE